MTEMMPVPTMEQITQAAGALLALCQNWSRRIDAGELELEHDCQVLREAVLILAHYVNAPDAGGEVKP